MFTIDFLGVFENRKGKTDKNRTFSSQLRVPMRRCGSCSQDLCSSRIRNVLEAGNLMEQSTHFLVRFTLGLLDGLLGVAGMITSDEMDHSRKFLK